MNPDPALWLVIVVALAGMAAACVLISHAGNLAALARRAASAWNRGKAVHDRIELGSREKREWRRIRRRFAREARHAADSERRPA